MDEISLERLIEIMEDINEEVDYNTCTTLVDDRYLDSFAILSLISAIDDEFDVQIPAKDIIPENFNSAEALCELINELANEE